MSNPLLPRKPEVVPQVFTVRDAATYLGVCERKLWTLTKAGRVRCIRLSDGPKAGKRYVITELDRFLAEG